MHGPRVSKPFLPRLFMLAVALCLGTTLTAQVKAGGSGAGRPANPATQVDPGAKCNSATASATGAKHFAFTSCRQDVWDRMQADYEASRSNPSTKGGKWYRWIRNRAENREYDGVACSGGLCYSNGGQFAAFIVAAEGCNALASDGSTRMADLAYLRIATYLDREEKRGYHPAPYSFVRKVDKNNVRNLVLRRMLVIDVIKPCITGPEYERAKVGLAEQIQGGLMTPTSFSLNLSDSDNTIGEYFHTRAHCLLEPTYQLAIDNCANVNSVSPSAGGRIGGLVATQTPQEYLAATTGKTARNAIRMYFEYLSEDGAWMEGNHYDLETVSIALQGYDAIRQLTGADHYPEITAWLEKHAAYLLEHITPDLLRLHSHGDLAEPRSANRNHFTATTMILAGLLQGTTAGQKLQDLIVETGDTFGLTGTGSIEPNAINENPFFYYNPYLSQTKWRATTSFTDRYHRIAMRKSHVSNINACHYFSDFYGPQRWNAALNKTVQVQHTDNLPGWGTWDLYCNGEWKVTDVKFNTVRGGGDGGNNTIIHGRSRQGNVYTSFWEPTDHANYFVVAGTTGGEKPLGRAYCGGGNTPDIFVHENTRRQVYVPSVRGTQLVITHDRINALTTVPEANCYTAAENARVTAFDVLGHVFLTNHAQTQPKLDGSAYIWAAPSGTLIKMTVAFPATFNSTIVNELTEVGYHSSWTTVPKNERKWHVRNSETTPRQWNTFLTAHEVLPSGGSFGIATAIADAGKVEGVHVTRSGEADVVAVFNSEQGANLVATAAHPSHDDDLSVVRFRAIGFELKWTSVAPTTWVILNDLNPSKRWTYTLNGGESTEIAEDAAGNAYLEISGAGGKVLVVTGS